MTMTSTLLGFGGIGPWEIALILIAILILFGGKKLPELARGMGQGMREFKKAARGVKDELESAANAVDEADMDTSPTTDEPAGKEKTA